MRIDIIKSPLAGVLLVGALLATSACGGDGTSIKTPDGTVKVDKDGSDFSLEGPDGTKVEGGTDLPDDFPEEVRLVEGRIIQAIKAGDANGGGFSVSVEVDGEISTVGADAVAKLTDAGFEESGYQASTAEMMTESLSSSEWQVLVSVSASGDDGKVFVNYTVAPASP